MTIQDWSLSYEELEPYYDKFDKLCGVSGKAGNLKGRIVEDGNPFEGPRNDEYPNKPIKSAAPSLMFADAAKSLGYHPFPAPVAIASAPYKNSEGIALGECQYCGYCNRIGCEANAKASANTTILPLLRGEPKFDLRTRAFVTKLVYDKPSKKVAGVGYTDKRTGEEYEQPANIVVLSSYVFGNTQALLLAGIGEPYDRATGRGVVGLSMGGSAINLIQFRTPGPVSVLECLDVPIPEPRSDEVLIRAHAIGVGMPDVLIRAGTYNFMPPLPAVPGQELSGTIEKVGAGVTTRRVGQRVYTSARERPHRGGHYAEFVASPADATFLLPDTVTFDTAATLANYQVAYHIFNDAVRPRKGQSVLIYAAAGGMGNALIDLAKPADLVVIGVVSGDES